MKTAEWKTKKKNWSNLDILAEAAAFVQKQDQRAERAKFLKTVSEEDEEYEKRFFSVFPRKSRSWVRIGTRNPQNPFQNLNGASTSNSTSSSSSLFDLNLTPCEFETNYLQFPWRSPSPPSILGDYTIAADYETENPQNPLNPNSQLSPYKSRKRPAVQQRKPNDGLKKAKVVPVSYSWMGKETPEWLVQVMRDMNVTGDAKLIFEKVLSSSDVSPTQARLLLPFNQLHRNDFLTPDESSYVRGQGGNNKPGVEAVVVNQNSEMWNVKFKIWEMKNTDNGKASLNYVMNYGWNHIVTANRLKEGHTISLWSFRCQDVLYFAFVLPPTIA